MISPLFYSFKYYLKSSRNQWKTDGLKSNHDIVNAYVYA